MTDRANLVHGDIAEFEPAGFFVLRTPTLPFDTLQSLSLGVRGATSSTENLETALAADRALIRGRISRIMDRPIVREAMFIASPSLSDRLSDWHGSPDSDRGRKVEPPLVRYLHRMASRATPFGLFAGCGVGLCGPKTDLAVPAAEECSRHTRLDMDYLFALAHDLNHRHPLRPFLAYRPNSSLYRAAGRIRLSEARRTNEARTYHLVALEPDDYLESMLEISRRGATRAEMAAVLVAMSSDISEDEALTFVDELIDAQVLVSDLWPTVSGAEPVHEMLLQLQALPESTGVLPLITAIRSVTQKLACIDSRGPGYEVRDYLAAASSLDGIGPEPKLARLFQVDLVKRGTNPMLAGGLVREMLRGVGVLHRISPERPNKELSTFCEQFVERYDSQEVPLVVALDEEIGIGTTDSANGSESPLLAGLQFPLTADSTSGAWTARHAWLLRRLEEVRNTASTELALEESDLKALENRERLPLPDSLAIMGAVAAESRDAIERGEYRIYVDKAMGPSGANLLGRFCHADATLCGHVRQLLAREEQRVPDALFAEVVHLPEGRIGNVLLRPVLREHEIPFLGRSGAAPECQIPVDDLMVSVVSGEIILRSRRLGRRVIPRLTTAHNYQYRALRLYRFLCSLQHQGLCGGVWWDWGPLETCAFLPRVSLDRIVFSRARWVIFGQEFDRLKKLKGTDHFEYLQAIRRMRAIPRYVVVPDADNELVVDLDNVLSVEAMADLLPHRSELVLTEMFPGPHELCSSGVEGRFVHEIVLPVVRNAPTAVPSPLSSVSSEPCRNDVVRRCPPGGEWLYVKLYAGAACADRVLQEMIGPLTGQLVSDGVVDSWFFIRYADPQWHLRLRIHGSPARLTGEVLPAIHRAAQPFLEDGSVWRLQTDTYEREVERYGGTGGIEHAERVFWHDSHAVVNILSLLEGDEGADARWRLALAGIDRLLGDFGLSTLEKLTFADTFWSGYSREMRMSGQFRAQLSDRFRRLGSGLDELLEGSAGTRSELGPALAILDQRSERLMPVVRELQSHAAAQRIELIPIIGSIAHMHVNRMLRSGGRRHELVLYDLLGRMYRSRLARSGHKVSRR